MEQDRSYGKALAANCRTVGIFRTPRFSPRASLTSAVGGLSGDQLRELFGRHRSRDAESLAHVAAGVGQPALGGLVLDRSEEHTSALQSLMRISYAVFCLKKKTKHS